MLTKIILLGSQGASKLRCSASVLTSLYLLISNLINKLRLHQFLGSKITETNKSLKTDANKAEREGFIFN